MNSRCALALSRSRPVVSSSSPPDSHGVGSRSSEMWTQRTGTSRFCSPARTATSRSPRTSRTVSTACASPSAVEHPAGGLLEDRPQDGLHLLELLGAGDERRRELDHRVAAVVGAADEAAAEELAGQEAAQQRLGLLVAEGLPRLAVLDELDRVEVTGAADVAHDLDVAQRLEHRPEVGLVLADVLEQALALEDVEVGERDRGAHRVPAPRDAVGEGVRALEERLHDAVAGDDGAHRGVRARQALGRRDHVGEVVVLLGAEHVAEPAVGADDLVGDQQDVVLVADLADALEVALGRREAAAGVLDRLHDDGRDRVGALELDAVRDGLREVLGAVAGRQAVEVRVRHVAAARGERLERLAQRRHAGGAERAHRRAVVGDLARDDLVLVRVARELVVLAGELQRGLDRLAAARGEEDAVEVAGRELGELGGELDRARVRVGPRREEAELLGLVGAGLGHVGAPVADVHAEQRAQAVEIAVAVLVPDVAPVALDDDRDVRLGVGAHAAEVQPEVALGEVLERALGCGGLRRGHRFSTSSASWSVCTTLTGRWWRLQGRLRRSVVRNVEEKRCGVPLRRSAWTGMPADSPGPGCPRRAPGAQRELAGTKVTRCAIRPLSDHGERHERSAYPSSLRLVRGRRATRSGGARTPPRTRDGRYAAAAAAARSADRTGAGVSAEATTT